MSSYQEVAEEVVVAMKERRKVLPMRVTLFHPNLFGPLPNDYLRHVLKRFEVCPDGSYRHVGEHPFLHPPKGPSRGYTYAKDLTPAFRRFLVNKLYWIGKVRGPTRSKIYDLCKTESGFKKLYHKLVSVEMRMNSIILSRPRLTYEEADLLNARLVNNTFNFPNYHKELKGFCKGVLKSVRTQGPIAAIPRQFSWVIRELKTVRLQSPDPEVAELLTSTLLQARASGLPTYETKVESIEKWIGTVTSDPGPDQIDVDSLEDYLRRKCSTRRVVAGVTKVSLGFTSAYESTREAKGKTGMASRLIEQEPCIHEVCLETGEIMSNMISSRLQAGKYLFHKSLHVYKEDPEHLLNVRVGTIDEVGGKARIITVPSFFANCILSTWAHITYDYLATSKEAYTGLKGSNHGWALCLDMSPSNPRLSWMFEGREVKAINSDLSEATDKAYHGTIRSIIRCLNRILGFPQFYSQTVEFLLSSPRPYDFHSADGGHMGVTTRGCFMGDSGSKTILTASGLSALSKMSTPRISRIVGDDHATICPDDSADDNLSAYISEMERMGYEVSAVDTYKSDYCFFAEETFKVNTDPSYSLETYISGRDGYIPYLDYPRVRLLSPVSSNVRGFPNTLCGKISLHGRHMEYSESNRVAHGIMHLASWIQDLVCNLVHKPEFVYFPRFLVNSGKPTLFGHDENFIDFITTQKGGRLLGNYMDLMYRAVSKTETNGRDVVTTHFDHRSNNFLRISTDETKVPREISEFLVLDTVQQRGVTPFIIGRLGNKLISETEVKMKINESEFLFNEVLPTPANVITLSERRRDFDEGLIRNFLSLWRRNSILLKFNYHEWYFDREKVEEFLRHRHPLRVYIPLGCAPVEGEENEVNELQLERDRDIEILWEWVKTNPQSLEDIPRALIRDDLPLLRDNPALHREPRVLVVSDDLKMVRNLAAIRSLNWRSTLRTYRCSVRNWVYSDLTAGSHFDDTREVVIDLGSLDGYIARVSDEELEPRQHGISLEMSEFIRPTRTPYVQEASEYDELTRIITRSIQTGESSSQPDYEN